jgi:hypothetical protein
MNEYIVEWRARGRQASLWKTEGEGAFKSPFDVVFLSQENEVNV